MLTCVHIGSCAESQQKELTVLVERGRNLQMVADGENVTDQYQVVMVTCSIIRCTIHSLSWVGGDIVEKFRRSSGFNIHPNQLSLLTSVLSEAVGELLALATNFKDHASSIPNFASRLAFEP